jgi:diacylglycerol O-acyltransferase
LTSPAEIVRGVRATLRGPRQVAAQVKEAAEAASKMLGAGMSAPHTPFNVEIGPHRRFEYVGTEIDQLKAVKNEHGGTLNDVVLSVVTGALGNYLRARGVDTRELELRALVPVSVRADSEHGALGNKVAGMMAPLPVWCEEPVERLHLITAAMGDLKASGQAVGAQVLTGLTDFAPPTVASQAARLQPRQRFFNLVVTNVPGPQFPLYLLGRRLIAMYPMVPLAQRQALCIGIFSYDGQLNFGLTGDYDAMSDLKSFGLDLQGAVDEIVAATPSLKKKRTKAKAKPKGKNGSKPTAGRSAEKTSSVNGSAPKEKASPASG